MGNKSYYAVISVLMISMVSMFYLYYSDTGEGETQTTHHVAMKSATQTDDVGGVITPAAQKFEIKKERRERKVQQTAAMKRYEKEDSDAFIARVEKQLEETAYLAENSYELAMEMISHPMMPTMTTNDKKRNFYV